MWKRTAGSINQLSELLISLLKWREASPLRCKTSLTQADKGRWQLLSNLLLHSQLQITAVFHLSLSSSPRLLPPISVFTLNQVCPLFPLKPELHSSTIPSHPPRETSHRVNYSHQWTSPFPIKWKQMQRENSKTMTEIKSEQGRTQTQLWRVQQVHTPSLELRNQDCFVLKLHIWPAEVFSLQTSGAALFH